MGQQLPGKVNYPVAGLRITASQPALQNLFRFRTKSQEWMVGGFAFAERVVAFFLRLAADHMPSSPSNRHQSSDIPVPQSMIQSFKLTYLTLMECSE